MDRETLLHVVRLIRHQCGEFAIECSRFTDQQIADLYVLQVATEEVFGPINHARLFMVVVTDIKTLNERNLIL